MAIELQYFRDLHCIPPLMMKNYKSAYVDESLQTTHSMINLLFCLLPLFNFIHNILI